MKAGAEPSFLVTHSGRLTGRFGSSNTISITNFPAPVAKAKAPPPRGGCQKSAPVCSWTDSEDVTTAADTRPAVDCLLYGVFVREPGWAADVETVVIGAP